MKKHIDITRIEGVYFTRVKVFNRLLNEAYFEEDYHFMINDNDNNDPF